MNGGQACRTIQETRAASFHADVRGLCAAPRDGSGAWPPGAPSEPPPSRRSHAATQPCTDPYADTLAAPSSLSEGRPQWCVDTGGGLDTMTTFELWEALERGQVLAWMRVWREGMECWTPVGEIAEFAWAIASIPEIHPEALPEPELPADAHTGPLSTPTLTPEPPPPESAIRPVIGPLPGARWIALGSAVALAAVISAIFLRLSAPPPAPGAVSGASAPAETPVLVLPSIPAERPAPEAAHHDERGQRRLPRGGRRAYGR